MGKPEGFIKAREVHSWVFHGCPDDGGSLWLGLSPKIETFWDHFKTSFSIGTQSQKLRLCWEHCFTRQCGVCCGRHGALDPLSSSRAWLLPCQKNLVCLWLTICTVHTYHLSNDLLGSNWCSLQESREKSSPFPKSSWAIFNFKRKELTAKPSSLSLGRQRWLLESVLDLAHSSACQSVWRWRWL